MCCQPFTLLLLPLNGDAYRVVGCWEEERVHSSDGADEGTHMIRVQASALRHNSSLRLAENGAPHPLAMRAAATSCSLLITGETGTGKGHLARWIHDHSPRSKKPFVPVNCGAIPDGLIDSHLFGHVRGAFSGAESDHPGLVRAADGGTLLLDEISELPPTAQVRLLRLLEEREVQPVGYPRPVKVDVRIIAATNRDLLEAVNQGTFRQDLYFRLDVVRLHILSLRERTDEIRQLLACFNAQFAARYGHGEHEFDESALRMLEQYHWPGNIRELRTVVERLHVLCQPDSGPISEHELAVFGQLRAAKPSSREVNCNPLQRFKHAAVQQALSASRGNISKAATTLGVHRSTIYRWLAQQQRVPA